MYLCDANESHNFGENSGVKIDVNSSCHSDLAKNRWEFNYKTDDDFPELVVCINEYINYKSEKYGFRRASTSI